MFTIIAIYHADCPDGTLAAAVLLSKYPEAKVFSLAHSHKPEELQAIIDQVTSETIAYTLDCVIGARELAEKAKELHIIDHHAPVEAETRAFAAEHPNVTFTFDNAHSGAPLTWMYLYPDTAIPEILLLEEDVDLWNWKYGERSRHAATFFNTIVDDPQEALSLLTTDIETIIARGKDMSLYEDALTRRFLRIAAPVYLSVGKHTVPMYNNFYFDSYLGNRMSEKHGSVSGVFDIRGENVRLSFRSKEGQTPTAYNIASSIGGGGHKHAAGARMNRETFFKAIA